MNIIAITNIYLFVCACAGLVYGLSVMFKKKQPLYFKLAIFPLACHAFSRVFYIVTLLCYGGLPATFNIGFFGFAAFFLFLYLQNVGTIDNLLDDEDKKFTKYKLLALIAPACEMVIAVWAFNCSSASISVRLSFVVLAALAGLAGYFNIKHALEPDVEGGIIRALRRFNILCFALEILTLAEVGLYCFGLTNPIIIQILLGILYIMYLPLLNKEMKKWIQ